MLKKDGLVSPTKASTHQEIFKCGDCLHFKQHPHLAHEDICTNLGVRPFAAAPRCFTPDYTKVVGNPDDFVAMINFLNSKTPQQKKIILGMLRTKPSARKLPIGTKLYLNVRGREYIDNYLAAFVVGYTSAGQLALAGSPDIRTKGRTFFAYMKDDKSVLTTQEWQKRFKKLRKAGRFSDPQGGLTRDITDGDIDDKGYEPPTIDKAPVEKRKVAREGKPGRRTDLVKILSF